MSRPDDISVSSQSWQSVASGNARVHNGHNHNYVHNDNRVVHNHRRATPRDTKAERRRRQENDPIIALLQALQIQSNQHAMGHKQSIARLSDIISATSTQSSTGDSGLGGQNLEPATDVSAARFRNHNSHGRHGKKAVLMLSLRPWLTSFTWSLSLYQSYSGWDVSLRTTNLVPHNAPIMKLCKRGDLVGVQKLIRDGKASPFDFDDQYGEFPIMIATQEGHTDIARYLFNLTGHFELDLDILTIPDDLRTRATVLEMILHEFGIETESLIREFWWWYTVKDAETAHLLLGGYCMPYETLPLQERLSNAISLDPETDVPLFMQVLGENVSMGKLALMADPHGNTAVHAVAERFFSSYYDDKPLTSQWLNFFKDLLESGADLSRANSGNESPLAHALCNRNGSVEKRVQSLREWATLLERLGVDLVQYGKRELGQWSSEFHLHFGSRPDDWCLLQGHIPMWSLRQTLPGAWPVDQYVPTCLPWRPTHEDVAYWPSLAGSLSQWEQTETDVPRAVVERSDSNTKNSSVQETVLDETSQDDTGPVARLFADSGRLMERETHRRRSSSQPPHLRTMQDAIYGGSYYSAIESEKHPWLTGFHFCSLDHRWRLGRHRWAAGGIYNRDPPSARKCMKQDHEPNDYCWYQIEEQMYRFREQFSTVEELRQLPYTAYRWHDY